ncbi:MAG: UDP-3-O-acyl-N-acetylglucosamine deacetylase [Xanthomonadaceae bacterium]|nr:UDP-3-O-acyl-N-acetylglucosamine deacetylase [Xanthomonadaceae bacterium]
MSLQHTMKKTVLMEGVGLHTGMPIKLEIRPAQDNFGIQFTRSDLTKAQPIRASYENVTNTRLATTLGTGKNFVSTVEHLMAALAGFGIDNAHILVGGPEVPIFDGSSAPFVEQIKRSGVETQQMNRPTLVITRRVELKIAEKWAYVEPSNQFEIHSTIEWDHPMVGFQELSYIEGKNSFDEIARARTFCFARDIESMKTLGLIRGGSLDCAVVLSETGCLNSDGLRYNDELVRHKVLDAIGDFKLAGLQIAGSFRLHRSGHDVHYQLLKAILKDRRNYEIVGADQATELPLMRLAASY